MSAALASRTPMHRAFGFNTQIDMERDAARFVRSMSIRPAAFSVETLLRASVNSARVPGMESATTCLEMLQAFVDEAMLRKDGFALALATNGQMQHELVFFVRWFRSGFPDVTLGHKLAASLMATQVSAEAAETMVFPWPAFLIRVPEGLVSIDGGDPIVAISVLQGDGGMVGFDAHTRSGTSLGTFRVPPSELIDRDDSADDPSLSHSEITATDERALVLLRRLVVGVVLELASESNTAAIKRGHHSKRRQSDDPQVWRFVLTRAVRVDVRAAITDFNLRGGSSPRVQSLIRGHHKRQAYGPSNALRKWIHVEPYWRGPEDAPIAVRSHALGAT